MLVHLVQKQKGEEKSVLMRDPNKSALRLSKVLVPVDTYEDED